MNIKISFVLLSYRIRFSVTLYIIVQMYKVKKKRKFCRRAGDHDLQYRCLLSKLNFSGDQRLKTAIELVHVAANLDQRTLCEAKFILAQV